MRSIYKTILYKRTPEELEKICSDPALSKSFGFWIDGKLQSSDLYNSVTGKAKYTWIKGKSIPYKKWYAKYCPKVSHDYTLGQLLNDSMRSPIFHISLAIIWISVSSYINYYKLANTVSEDNENKLAASLIVTSFFLHYFLYYVLFTMASVWFGNINSFNILMILFLLFNPITLPTIIILLNLANVQEREKYKEYLWKINTGFSVFYGILGLLMGWVSLFFWF
jgi:hypothetical protein